MSIENTLERIATALETIAKRGNDTQKAQLVESVAAAPVAAAPVADMTPVELNAALVVEFKRLGGRELIDEVMTKQFNIQSINDLAAEQRGALITAVKALVKA